MGSEDFENLGWTDNGIFSVLILNVIIGTVVTAVFVVLRQRKGNQPVYAPRTDPNHKASRMSLPEDQTCPDGVTSYFGWIPSTLTIKDDDIMARSGLDAVMYLRLYQYLIKVVAVSAVLGLLILLPINESGHENLNRAKRLGSLYYSGFPNWTISNLKTNDSKLWAHLVVFLVVSCVFYYALYHLLRNFYETRRAYKLRSGAVSSAVTRTVWVRNLPRVARSGRLVARHIETTQYPDSVVQAEMAFNLPALTQLTNERTALIKTLRRTRNVWAKDQREKKEAAQRPQLRSPACYGDKIDAIESYEKKLQDLNARIAAEQKRADHPTTGDCFVTFKTTATQKRCVQNYHFKYDESQMEPASADKTAAPPSLSPLTPLAESKSSDLTVFEPTKWEVLPAPHPMDIYWPNLAIAKPQRVVRTFVMETATWWLIIFWTIPVAFLGSLNNLAAIPYVGVPFEWLLKNLPPAAVGFIGAYLPTIVVIVFNALLPAILKAIVVAEGVDTLSQIYILTMQKMATFLTFSNVILPAVVVGSIGALQTIFEDFAGDPANTLLAILVTITTPDTGYFIALVTQTAIMGSAMSLLRIGPLISRYLALKLATTEQDREDANAIPPFDFYLAYPYMILVVVISFFFSITMPITPIFGLLWFGLHYFSDRYALAYIHPRVCAGDQPGFSAGCAADADRHGGGGGAGSGGAMFCAAVRVITVIFLFFQIATAGIFAGKGAVGQFIIAVLFAVFTGYVYTQLSARLVLIFNHDMWLPDLNSDAAKADQSLALLEASQPSSAERFSGAYKHPALRELNLSEGSADVVMATEAKDAKEEAKDAEAVSPV